MCETVFAKQRSALEIQKPISSATCSFIRFLLFSLQSPAWHGFFSFFSQFFFLIAVSQLRLCGVLTLVIYHCVFKRLTISGYRVGDVFVRRTWHKKKKKLKNRSNFTISGKFVRFCFLETSSIKKCLVFVCDAFPEVEESFWRRPRNKVSGKLYHSRKTKLKEKNAHARAPEPRYIFDR